MTIPEESYLSSAVILVADSVLREYNPWRHNWVRKPFDPGALLLVHGAFAGATMTVAYRHLQATSYRKLCWPIYEESRRHEFVMDHYASRWASAPAARQGAPSVHWCSARRGQDLWIRMSAGMNEDLNLARNRRYSREGPGVMQAQGYSAPSKTPVYLFVRMCQNTDYQACEHH